MDNTMERLSFKQVKTEDQLSIKDQPIKVLQVGEGNFLRGFFDWMIHESHRKGNFQGSIAVTQPRPSGKKKMDELKSQDGLYTLLIRGLQNGEKVERREVISVFSEMIDPYSEWNDFMALAENPTLEFIVSNTTEAGLAYRPTVWDPSIPMESFPARLTAFLYRRFLKFEGQADKGLIMFPCELLEKNGDLLQDCVLKYIEDWELSFAFKEWVKNHNLFLNSLVDRIVTGFPTAEAEAFFEEWGYEDRLLNVAEPYHLWVIEGDPALDERLPLHKSGLNVHWVRDLKPFQMRKVRILNGAHSLMAPLGILYGFNEVRQAVEDPDFGSLIRKAIFEEFVPAIPYDLHETREYADSVIERFLNPFIRHRLQDISLNSLSKYKARLLPTLEIYSEQKDVLPKCTVRAIAGLLRFYKVRKTGDQFVGQRFNGEEYAVMDDAASLSFFAEQWARWDAEQVSLEQMVELILGNELIWGKDLNRVNGLLEAICNQLNDWLVK